MSADLLRRAAAKLRETAAPLVPTSGDQTEWARFYLKADHALTREDSAWIALMSPAHAEPLAALLDETASQYDGPKCDAPHGCCNNCESRFDFVVAIDLARAVLGEVAR